MLDTPKGVAKFSVVTALGAILSTFVVFFCYTRGYGVEEDCDRERRNCKPTSVAKAMYFAVQTATTIGFGSGLDLQDDGLRWFVVFSCLCGSVAFGIFVSVLAALLLKRIERKETVRSTNGATKVLLIVMGR